MSKVIGLIGGMSWESSVHYYQIINRGVRNRLGGHNNAKSLMLTVNFAQIEALQRAGAWQAAGDILVDASQKLEAGGAEMILLCTNTMHKVAPQIEEAVGVPFIHIADATADAIAADGLHSIGLLGTMYTMEQDFYKGRLAAQHGLEVLVPEDKEDRDLVHRVIFEELVNGEVKESSRLAYEAIIRRLVDRGAEGVILGCTEIGMLVDNSSGLGLDVPIYDTTVLHAEAAVRMALEGMGE